ncbi:pteridine reductase [Neiella sp. HB171785]|uniref:Pteridine reductase n=1 Tax=Neiella litorisoli TaxID=2771431 RepID=A0A8J6UPV5_9GAMM|nr:pteridine reductase [Neiella litorisoli]MBD1389582.1 pteridine reductase [Neiella litorisoli]
MVDTKQPVVVITGAAKRIGKAIAEQFHQAQYHVIVHYHQSEAAAANLVQRFNEQRPDSASLVAGDLSSTATYQRIADHIAQQFGRLDVLINNASNFYPTQFGDCSADHFNDLMAINAQAPLLLSQQLTPLLSESNGVIINLVDIHADKPYRDHATYCMAKAALKSLTKSLALELAPNIRVNGVSPGAILWPEQMSPAEQQNRLAQLPLQQHGCPKDVADAVFFLASARYITGQIVAVDGGASLV